MAHEHGVTNVGAALVTTLGREHIRQLKRYERPCTVVFDADAAGQKASDSSLQIFVEEGMEVSVATLPEGKDPCDCLVDLGAQAFGECRDGACDIFEFGLREAEKGAELEPKRAAEIVDGVLDLVARVPNVFERKQRLDRLILMLNTRCGGLLGEAEASVRRRLARIAPRSARGKARRNSVPDDGEQPGRLALPPIERELLTVCLHDTLLFPRLNEKLDADDFSHDDLRAVFEAAAGLLKEEGEIHPDRLSARIPEPEHASLLAQLLSEAGSSNYENRLESCLETFERHKTQQHIEKTKQEMLAAAREGDTANSQRLQLEYSRLKQQQQQH